jgi:signal transduction histidine kinase
VKKGRVATLNSKNGLPCDTVNSAIEDNNSIWLYMACGLVRVARPELDAWAADSKRKIQVRVFDSSDGVRSHATPSGHSPRMAKTADGKIWFLPLDGVSVIDPRHLSVNNLPPPVHVEQITADRKTYWQNLFGDAASQVRLPPRVRDLEIDYTALSFVAPEKVQFRYKLDGRDRDWQDAGTRRQAYYTDLAPGDYHFHVAACNNSGVWNMAGDTLDFYITPAYYQTLWFRFACAAAFLALLWALYRYRLHQVAQEFNRTLDARVGERTRIARELHDTLLQSFHGMLLRFQTAQNLLPERPAEARKMLESAIEQAAQAITEGRDAVQGLRQSTVETNDLALALKTLGEELSAAGGNGKSAAFFVDVEGVTRNLHPILRDEIYRVAGEALRNAARHAQARKIEVEIHYDDRELRLRVRDDGKGIDPKVLKDEGREGHFGLRGMRERIELVGGQLDVWSEPNTGTEIEFRIPASIAYATSAPKQGRSWFRGEKT